MQKGLFAAAFVALIAASAGCPSGDGTGGSGGGGGPSGPAWQSVYSATDLGGAVLSAWGSSPEDVYLVGGPLGNGGTAVVAHYGKAGWKKLNPGGEDSYWWVTGTGANDLWMVGEKGRITHYDGGAFVEHQRPTTATLWGVWAASPNDVWAVGGTPGGGLGAPNDLVFHWDGASWSQVPLPAPAGKSLNKVWGTSSQDLYAVGEAGAIWHKKGDTWVNEGDPPLAQGNLLTVYGCSATDVYAVGGSDVLHSDGTTWTKVDVALSSAVNGVTCSPSGEVLITGFGGSKQRLVGGKWVDEFDVEPFGDFHGAWADSEGSFWIAGGDFVTKASPGKARKANIGRYGKGRVTPLAL